MAEPYAIAADVRRPGDFVSDLIRRHEAMKSDRATWETLWQDVIEYVHPDRADFNVKRTAGTRRGERRMEATATWALQQFASGLSGSLTNPAVRWFVLTPADERLGDNPRVSRWLEDVTDILYAVLNRPQSNFAPQLHELYLDLGAFGTGIMRVEEVPGQGIVFATHHLSECYVAENARGVVDTLHREWEWTARQAFQAFGREAGENVVKALEANQPDKQFTFLHAVFPSRERRGRAWKGCYVNVSERRLVETGFFDEFPFMVPRWTKTVKETYGRSPAVLALPDIKLLNVMYKTLVVAAQKVADPPWLLPHDGFVLPINTRPGGMNYVKRGLASDDIRPMLSGARIDIGLDMVADKKADVARAFFVDVMRMNEGPQMTATEVIARRNEMYRHMGPMLSRLQSELLGPLIDRVFLILLRNGVLPPVPPELQGAEIGVEYMSAIASAQKQGEADAIAAILQMAQIAAQFDPRAARMINGEMVLRESAKVFRPPSEVLRTPDDMEAMDQRDAQAAQAQSAAADSLLQAELADKVAGAQQKIATTRK